MGGWRGSCWGGFLGGGFGGLVDDDAWGRFLDWSASAEGRDGRPGPFLFAGFSFWEDPALFCAVDTGTSARDGRPRFGFWEGSGAAFPAREASGDAWLAAHHGLSSADRRSLLLRRVDDSSVVWSSPVFSTGREGFCAGPPLLLSSCPFLPLGSIEGASAGLVSGWRSLLLRRLDVSAGPCFPESVACRDALAAVLPDLEGFLPSSARCAVSPSPASSVLSLLRGRDSAGFDSAGSASRAFGGRPLFLGVVPDGSPAWLACFDVDTASSSGAESRLFRGRPRFFGATSGSAAFPDTASFWAGAGFDSGADALLAGLDAPAGRPRFFFWFGSPGALLQVSSTP